MEFFEPPIRVIWQLIDDNLSIDVPLDLIYTISRNDLLQLVVNDYLAAHPEAANQFAHDPVETLFEYGFPFEKLWTNIVLQRSDNPMLATVIYSIYMNDEDVFTPAEAAEISNSPRTALQQVEQRLVEFNFNFQDIEHIRQVIRDVLRQRRSTVG